MAVSILTSILFFVILLLNSPVEALQIDLEASLQNKNTDFEKNKFSVEKAGFGIKKIIPDQKGDRLYLFFRAESEDNFKETHIDQLYVKYKGPMGRWNLVLGRSHVPFGLIPDYNSEMLALHTQEDKTIGYRSDDGIKLSGFWKSVDYELLLSPGEWMGSQNKDDNDKVAALRISREGYDIENLKVGISFLMGTFLDEKKYLAGIDIIKYRGPLVSRNEIVIGEEGDKDLVSFFIGVDHSIYPSIDLNFAYTYYKCIYDEKAAFLGMTYNTPFFGIALRVGNQYYFNDRTGGDKNEVYIQLYKHYSYYF